MPKQHEDSSKKKASQASEAPEKNTDTSLSTPTPDGKTFLDPLLEDIQVSISESVHDIYYDVGKKNYIFRNTRGSYIDLRREDIRLRLKKLGLSPEQDHVTKISPVDDALLLIQNDNAIQYAGPLAGHRCGAYEQGGNRILVTREAGVFPIIKGFFDILWLLLENMFGPGSKQLETFLGWWKGTIFEPEKPRQGLVIAGEAGSGKSLLQKIITESLGGRVAKPYSLLTRRTDFNADLFGAEHLIVDDECANTDYRSREALGNQIKQIVVNKDQRLHAKGRDAIMLRPFWVLTFSLNDEPENLQVLPRMEDSLEDKIILLKAEKKRMPMPTSTSKQQNDFLDRLIQDASGLLFMLKDKEMSTELKSDRYVVKHYHHPDILEVLKSVSRETEFLDLIDTVFYHCQEDFRGTAAAIEKRIRLEHSRQVDKLFSFPNACGTLLGRLAKSHPKRIKNARRSSSREWIIIKNPASRDVRV